jgi:hypothetical protein
VTVSNPIATQIQVTIGSTQNPVFGRIFGLGSKTLTATAIAAGSPNAPAIWAGGGCGATTGLKLGGGPFTITGEIDGNGQLADFTGGGDIDNGKVTGNPACPPAPWRGPPGQPTGGIGTGAAVPNPWGYDIFTDFPACTVGNLTIPGPPLAISTGLVPPGVYCNDGDINLGTGSPIVAIGVTFLATGDITIGSGAITNMTPAANSHNLIAFSTAPDDCLSGHPAINVGNTNAVLNGSFYAPAGCINMGGPGFVITGSLVGNEVNVSGPSWTIDSGGAGGGAAVTLYQ